MTEIMPGIHQLKVPIPDNPLGNTNSYLLRWESKALIIDPGMNHDNSFEVLKKELAEAGVSPEDITHIVATHSHPDHYGLAGRLKEISNATIYAHKSAIEMMKLMAQRRQGHGQGHEMEDWLKINGFPDAKPEDFPRGGPPGRRGGPPNFGEMPVPDVLFEGGEKLTFGGFELEVIFTPGHDAGHICLYESTTRTLFSGDHVLPVITPSVNVRTESISDPLGDFMKSLQLVRNIDVKMVLPGHENPFSDLSGRVDEIIAHHDYRHSEILGALGGEPKSAFEISHNITWMPYIGGKRFEELNPWEKRMAVMETLAHLKVLTEDGRVSMISETSSVFYRKG